MNNVSTAMPAPRLRDITAALLLCAALSACGGGGGSGSSSSSSSSSGSSSSGSSGAPGPGVIGGTATGGRQPIVGSAVKVYAAGATTGGAATLIGSATTDSGGAFNIASFSPQPSDGQLIYVVVSGGDAGGGSDNGAVRLMTVAGAWNAPGFPATVNVDEPSTVAAVYTLAHFIGFGGGVVNVSGPSPGLANAAAGIANLVDVVSGQPATTLNLAACTGNSAPANCATLRKLNSLASVTASCINSSGPASGSCSGLFAHSGGAGDTLGALYNIATVPAARNDGTGIYGLVTLPQVYSPGLNAVPNDWTLALSFSGGGLSQPSGIAVDAAGNIWVTDYVQLNQTGNSVPGALSKLGPTGAALSPATGYLGNGLIGPLGIAITPNGHVWVADWNGGGNNQVSQFNADGSAVTGSPYTAGVAGPIDLAVTSGGNVWVANYGNSTITQLNGSGGIVTGPVHGPVFPTGIALDAAGRVWVVNAGDDSIGEFSGAGVAIGKYNKIGLGSPYAVAIDLDGNAWTANQGEQSVTELMGGSTPPGTCPAAPVPAGSTGCTVSPLSSNGNTGGYTGAGLAGPLSVAIDGAGAVFVTNPKGASISLLGPDGSALSPASSGYTGPGLAGPYGLAIDPSGNVWVANSGGTSVTEFIGLATPVVTPKIGPPLLP